MVICDRQPLEPLGTSTEELTEAVRHTSSFMQAAAQCHFMPLALHDGAGHKWVQQSKLAPQKAPPALVRHRYDSTVPLGLR